MTRCVGLSPQPNEITLFKGLLLSLNVFIEPDILDSKINQLKKS